jgi:hypothetical protein
VKKSKGTSKDFYQHTETGQVLVIERRVDGTILGSCTASEPLKELDSYECKPDNNLRVQENSHKLILYEAGG